jgi:hypothetical protein
MAFKSRYYVETRDHDADIKVDYDSHKNPPNLAEIREAAAWLKRRSYKVRRVIGYTTGRGYHVRIWLVWGAKETGHIVPPYTVLRMQRMMGDDPVRARFNECRVRRQENGWNVLWTEKWRNGLKVSEERVDNVLTKQLERIFTS